MKVNILVLLCAVALTRAGYHQDIGFPLAARIKEAEDKLFATEPKAKSAKIIGGKIAPLDEHPYLGGLLILFGSWRSLCGSSLISANRLVTTAHCLLDDHGNPANKVEVVLGSQYLFHGGLRIFTSIFKTHSRYHGNNNDIALIYLPQPVKFSKKIHPISLPKPTKVKDQFVGYWATAAGYGLTKDSEIYVPRSTQVSNVRLRIIPEATCHNSYLENSHPGSIICTSGEGHHGHVGVCDGDSGGPLFIVKNGVKILIGITSFRHGKGCELGSPSGFTRVSYFL